MTRADVDSHVANTTSSWGRILASVAALAIVLTPVLGAPVPRASASQTSVSTFSELSAAVATSGTVVVSQNITGGFLRLGVNAAVVLDLAGHDVVVSSQQSSRPAIRVVSGMTFTVRDSVGGGSLTADAKFVTAATGAGIGSEFGSSAGSIIIESGHVIARGGEYAAGIGGGGYGGAGSITILGGSVMATGGGAGAGIGGGRVSGPGSIVITGGSVEAVGGIFGAGIGGGEGNNGDISVRLAGGDVIARGGVSGAGIGGGNEGPGLPVTIEGGTVTATEGPRTSTAWARAIGAGQWGSGQGTLDIHGTRIEGSSSRPTQGPVPINTVVPAGVWYELVNAPFGEDLSTEIRFLYTVLFDSLGGTAVAHQIVPRGSNPTEPQAPNREGSVFVRWVTVSGDPYDFSSAITGPTTVVADWEAQISGTPPTIIAPNGMVVGATVEVDGGSWSPAPASLAYRWLRDGEVIDGATGSTYEITNLDAGSRLAVEESATRSGHAPATSTSAQSAIVTGGVFETQPPRVTGPWFVGRDLSVEILPWAPAASSTTFQWLRNGVPITGARSAQYRLVDADLGAAIAVTVTGERPGVAGPISLTSEATLPIRPRLTSPPTLRGTVPSRPEASSGFRLHRVPDPIASDGAPGSLQRHDASYLKAFAGR
ncbi:InlB B-repeat-containing protein [Microcella sp.]|uniref:InlB B-repeat-containing protein n=1 Tax=Microcella sp. TaxID=1913979 RepID=UPI00391BD656